ncbi:hypothetical protein KY330_01590 [Candidatus Woesearchaeota archaeon]|nr:hypothetical protein [Candidatus Woesearchaeota archaeon]
MQNSELPNIITKIEEIIGKPLQESNAINFITDSNNSIYPFSFEKEKLRIISKLNLIENKDKTITFIDGGNSELISAPNLSLNYVRICALTYKNKRRIQIIKKELYVLAYLDSSQDQTKDNPQIKVETFPESLNLRFAITDPTLSHGKRLVEVSTVSSYTRRLLELNLAEELTKESDYIVLDGSLKSSATYEQDFIDNLFNTASQNNCTISALSKTSRIFASSFPIHAFISQNSSDVTNPWYYPMSLQTFLIKLNTSSRHVFTFESSNPNEILSLLAEYSKDHVFPGYPYPLILTDRLARVSNKETSYLLTKLQTSSKQLFELLKPYISILDAHSILDSIS